PKMQSIVIHQIIIYVVYDSNTTYMKGMGRCLHHHTFRTKLLDPTAPLPISRSDLKMLYYNYFFGKFPFIFIYCHFAGLHSASEQSYFNAENGEMMYVAYCRTN